jgi:hypothetical protein
MTTPEPAPAAKQRARVIQLPFPCGCLDAHEGGGMAVEEYTCKTHRAIATELSAKDAEIERERELKRGYYDEAVKGWEKCHTSEAKFATARADAIRECVEAIRSLVNKSSAMLRRLTDEGYDDEAEVERVVQLTSEKARATLESLLNKEK